VLHNIISNAVKYTDKEEKRIDMRASVLGDEVQVYVTDNGKGIAAKDLANVFDRFYRADSSRSSSEGGSGIGLSIVKKIVEDHGGRVWVSSKEGEGTTMAFALRKYEEN
jgi:signal transduction histidine kinase